VEERNDAEDGAGYQREGWDDGWKESSPWPRGAEEEVDGGGQENPFSAEKSPARRPIPESLEEQRGEIVVKVIIDGKPAARNEGQRWIRLRPVQMASDSRVVVDLRGSDTAQERIGAEVGGREIADGCKPGWKPGEEVNAVEDPTGKARGTAVVVDLRGFDTAKDLLVFEVDNGELTVDDKVEWAPEEEKEAVGDPTWESHGTAERPLSGSAPA
jgi:hypothetical protein